MQWFPNHKISSKILAINATFLLFPGIVTFTGCFRITMMHPTNLLVLNTAIGLAQAREQGGGRFFQIREGSSTSSCDLTANQSVARFSWSKIVVILEVVSLLEISIVSRRIL
ncbi:MAG: hypothetical protein QN189_04360 [Armatimonadota bacterium]|nr:hypothetical protein [Armatimonadota bacterium]